MRSENLSQIESQLFSRFLDIFMRTHLPPDLTLQLLGTVCAVVRSNQSHMQVSCGKAGRLEGKMREHHNKIGGYRSMNWSIGKWRTGTNQDELPYCDMKFRGQCLKVSACEKVAAGTSAQDTFNRWWDRTPRKHASLFPAFLSLALFGRIIHGEAHAPRSLARSPQTWQFVLLKESP